MFVNCPRMLMCDFTQYDYKQDLFPNDLGTSERRDAVAREGVQTITRCDALMATSISFRRTLTSGPLRLLQYPARRSGFQRREHGEHDSPNLSLVYPAKSLSLTARESLSYPFSLDVPLNQRWCVGPNTTRMVGSCELRVYWLPQEVCTELAIIAVHEYTIRFNCLGGYHISTPQS